MGISTKAVRRKWCVAWWQLRVVSCQNQCQCLSLKSLSLNHARSVFNRSFKIHLTEWVCF